MTIAVVDGDPPLPPEHIRPTPFGYGTIGAENGSKHPDAASVFTPQHPGTQLYVPNAAAKSNGSQKIDHDPPNPIPPTPSHAESPSRDTHLRALAPPLCNDEDDFPDITPSTAPSTAIFNPNRSYDDDTATTTPQPATTYQSPPFKPYYLPPSRFDLKAMVASMDNKPLPRFPTTTSRLRRRQPRWR